MPLDLACAGRVYPVTPAYEVGREDIRRFAAAVGDPHPAFRDPAAARALGHPDVIAPPTFPYIVATQVIDEVVDYDELGFAPDLVVHADQSFTITRPVYAGDRLATSVRIQAARRVRGDDILVFAVELTDAHDKHVSTVRMTYVSRTPREDRS
jgi:acyl dehydratase